MLHVSSNLKPDRLAGKTLFIGIGAQKTGTTWLYNWLSKHPSVLMSPLKEMHVFDRRRVFKGSLKFQNRLAERIINLTTQLRRQSFSDGKDLYFRLNASVEKISMINNLEYYLEHFNRKVGDEIVFGEITPAYSLLDRDGFKEIESLHNSIKYIFIMRDPIKRAWSHVNYESARNKISRTIDEKMRLIGSSRQNNTYFNRSDYARTITEIEAVVPVENILYLFYEELFTEEAASKISAFLNIPCYEAEFDAVINKGVYPDSDMMIIRENFPIYDDIYEFCGDRFGNVVERLWQIK